MEPSHVLSTWTLERVVLRRILDRPSKVMDHLKHLLQVFPRVLHPVAHPYTVGVGYSSSGQIDLGTELGSSSRTSLRSRFSLGVARSHRERKQPASSTGCARAAPTLASVNDTVGPKDSFHVSWPYRGRKFGYPTPARQRNERTPRQIARHRVLRERSGRALSTGAGLKRIVHSVHGAEL